MKRARGHAGYTILETMIFLVISGALLSSATILFDGRIQRAQFTQGVQQLDAHIRSTISEVASGTYTDDNTFYCRLTASGPQVGTASFEENQGTRQACIFAGKVTHFAITSDGSPPCTESGGAITADSECSLVNTYTTVGLRTDFSQPTFTSAIQSKPVPINGFTSGGGNPDLIDLTSHYPLNNGLHVTGMKIMDASGPGASISAYALLLNSQGSYSSPGSNLTSGSSGVQLLPLLNSGSVSTIQKVDDLMASPAVNLTMVNPDHGIAICLGSGTSKQVATIRLGANKGSLTTKVTIGEDACS